MALNPAKSEAILLDAYSNSSLTIVNVAGCQIPLDVTLDKYQ